MIFFSARRRLRLQQTKKAHRLNAMAEFPSLAPLDLPVAMELGQETSNIFSQRLFIKRGTLDRTLVLLRTMSASVASHPGNALGDW